MSSERVHPDSRRYRPPKGVHPFPGDEWWSDDEWRQQITDAIKAAQAAGDCARAGGVPVRAIGARLDRTHEVTRYKLKELAADGILKQYQARDPETSWLCHVYELADTDSDSDGLVAPWSYLHETREEWSEEHAVIPEFLPFAFLSYDRLGHIRAITEFLSTRPDWCKSVSRTTIRTQIANATNTKKNSVINLEHVEPVALLCGWWYTDEVSRTGTRYFANPDYRHDHGEETILTDWEDGRKGCLEAALSLGMGAGEIAPAFGLSPDTICDTYAPRLEPDWHEQKERGKRRMDRTIRTIMHWGATQEEVGAAFGLSNGGVANATKRTKEDGFVPPVDPTFKASCNTRPGEVVR